VAVVVVLNMDQTLGQLALVVEEKAEIEALHQVLTQLVVQKILVVEVVVVQMVLQVVQTHKIEFLDQVVKVLL
jgi:hypothetical protein